MNKACLGVMRPNFSDIIYNPIMDKLSFEITPEFSKRQHRTEWLFKRFSHLFSDGRVLDVGCFEAPLRNLIGSSRYVGVDFSGNPDMILNLETVNTLPFVDKGFDTVICIEVLEHLNNIHILAEDLFRVANKQVLISLPNCWRDVRVRLSRGYGAVAHYGLPLAAPKDRHKWLFNTQEAVDFLGHIKPSNYSVEFVITEKNRPLLIRWLRKLRYPGWRYLNRYAQTVYALYTKID